MMRILLLAWRYITFHKDVAVILLISITATLYLPITVNILIERLENQLLSRADCTPLIVGAKGSRFDLTLNTLYFEARAPHEITMRENQVIAESGLAVPIPLHVRFKARGFPIVGSSYDYFDFRKLKLAAGHNLGILGDCLIGANVAHALDLKPGDRLMSDPENVFDIGGSYPLNMKIVGILVPSRTPDDNAVIVDIKTTWIIEGIGHGHQNLSVGTDSTVVLQQSDSLVVANAALQQYTMITPDNLASFHFHADPAELPLTAVIALPHDKKSAVLLEGRYDNEKTNVQILKPSRVVSEMMAIIFKIKKIFDAGMILIALTTSLFLALVIILSFRLRKNEMHTMFNIGCSKMTVFWMQTMEIVLILAAGIILATILTLITLPLATDLIKGIVT